MKLMIVTTNFLVHRPGSRSSPRPQVPSVPRPPTPSLLPTEANTVDDVSGDHKNGVLNAKSAEASKQAPSILVNGRKRKHTKGTEDKTQETSTSQTNRNENQSEPKDQSDKPQNLSATTRDEEKHTTIPQLCVYCKDKITECVC